MCMESSDFLVHSFVTLRISKNRDEINKNMQNTGKKLEDTVKTPKK